jgi:hypothetical protein
MSGGDRGHSAISEQKEAGYLQGKYNQKQEYYDWSI